MSLTCGLVGLPNVGKSTIFNAITQTRSAEAANFPFCTIEPNVGRVSVPDSRLKLIHQFIQTQKVIPSFVDFVDIAGLVAGASKGEGLGNKFLSHIREVSAIVHVVRCFEDSDITHVSGSIDPLRDIETIETELLLADLESLAKAKERVRKNTKSGQKDKIEEFAFLEDLEKSLSENTPAYTYRQQKELGDHQTSVLQSLHLLSDKPVLYCCNVSDEFDLTHANKVKELAQQKGFEQMVICGKIEEELIGMDPAENAAFMEELGIEEPGLHSLIRLANQLLGLQCYFTAGEKEIRSWTITEGSTAPQAAGKIHTDFINKFIRAEVIKLADLEKYKSKQAVKEAGKMSLEGKDYIVQDGDLIEFRIGG